MYCYEYDVNKSKVLLVYKFCDTNTLYITINSNFYTQWRI